MQVHDDTNAHPHCYVVTNPPGDMLLMTDDRLFVLGGSVVAHKSRDASAHHLVSL
jgi:hypothetical protein